MDFYEKIDDYQNGRLAVEERAAFEEAMKKDPDLALAVKYREEVEQVKDYLLEEEVRASVQDIQKQTAKMVALKRRRRMLVGAVAGFLLLIFGIVYMWKANISQKPVASSSLFEQYFELYNGEAVRSGQSDILTDYQLGMSRYNEKDYKGAIIYFNKIEEGTSAYVASRFFLGNAYLATDSPSAAKEAFSVVLENKDPRFEQAAQWYRGLAFLQMEDLPRAMKIFKNIKETPGHAYKSEAEELLELSAEGTENN